MEAVAVSNGTAPVPSKTYLARVVTVEEVNIAIAIEIGHPRIGRSQKMVFESLVTDGAVAEVELKP
jgi:hypothetical protein